MSFMATQLVGFGVVGGEWRTTMSQTLNNNTTGYGGFTIRQWFAAGVISLSGNPVRVRLTPTTTGLNTILTGIYIGHAAGAGDAYDFDGAQVQVLFSGSGSVTLTAGGASVTSDEIGFALDETKNLIVSMQHAATSSVRDVSGLGANYVSYQKAGAEAATTNVTGYSTLSGTLTVCDLIEVFA